MNWQPIETAPKDRRILVCRERKDAAEASSCRVVNWISWKSCWFDGMRSYDAAQFTHWMPQPETPVAT